MANTHTQIILRINIQILFSICCVKTKLATIAAKTVQQKKTQISLDAWTIAIQFILLLSFGTHTNVHSGKMNLNRIRRLKPQVIVFKNLRRLYFALENIKSATHKQMAYEYAYIIFTGCFESTEENPIWNFEHWTCNEMDTLWAFWFFVNHVCSTDETPFWPFL